MCVRVFVWQSSSDLTSLFDDVTSLFDGVTSLFDEDYCYVVTPRATVDVSQVKTSQCPKSSVLPRLATVCFVAMQDKDYLGKRHSSYDVNAFRRMGVWTLIGWGGSRRYGV